MRKGDAADLIVLDLLALGLEYEVEYPFAKQQKRRFRADYYVPSLRLLIELDGGSWIGGRHTSGVGFRRDAEKRNLGVTLGYRWLNYTPDMVQEGMLAADVQQMINQAAVLQDSRKYIERLRQTYDSRL